MAHRRALAPALMLLAVVLIAAAWYTHRSGRPGRLALRIHPVVGEETLVLDQVRYANPGGEGTFKVRDFQFFISNRVWIKITKVLNYL